MYFGEVSWKVPFTPPVDACKHSLNFKDGVEVLYHSATQAEILNVLDRTNKRLIF